MPLQDQDSAKSGKKWKFFICILLLTTIACCIFYFFVRIRHIEPGFVGVKSTINNPADNSSDYEMSVVKGYVVYIPLLTDVRVYPTTVQTISYNNMSVTASDGVDFRINPRISYQLDENRILSYYKNFKEDLSKINNGYLKEITANAFILSAGNFDSDSLANNRSTFEKNANLLLTENMNKAGFLLKNLNSNLEIPQKIKDLVELRAKTKQDALLATEEINVAYAKANMLRVQDSLINASLTPLSIQKMFIEKWDGKLNSSVSEPKAYRDINTDADKSKENQNND